MVLKVLYFLCFIFETTQINNTKRRESDYPTLVPTAIDIANFVYGIVNGENDQDSPEDLEEAKHEIITVFSEKLAVVQGEFYGSINETMSLSKINEINHKIQSVLLDLRALLLANESDKNIKKEEFQTQAALIIAAIRSLPSCLDPDLSHLELMATNSICNMSGIYKFKEFFFNLTHTGIIIELSYKKITQNSSLEPESERWNNEVQQMIDYFEREDSTCKSSFQTILRSDMENFDNVKELSNILHQKYVWYIIDVFILQDKRSGEEMYIEGKETKMMTMSVNGLRKYLIYSDRQTKPNTIKCVILKTNIQTPLGDIFILDRDSPIPEYVSTTEGNFKKTLLYNGTDKTCHPEVVSVVGDEGDWNERGELTNGLSTGAIIGIVVGGSLGFLTLSFCCFYCFKKFG
ncbi:uncharacterized protein LOC128209564 [Mya arenaria]|uniref:uncharacterized protein LOC128209564 n=1 Tax=Mya arenaria TaxID=6604 RepID=UPI0022DF225B|nr:uncharacterized protein LOC128209564 [Mya arenaria]